MEALSFAHNLAGNEKAKRDRAIKALRRYLAARSRREKEGFSDKDLIKIWKGLYYCMYMADKPLIQEELADSISELMHNFGHRKDCQRFIKQGFLTFAREWNNLDIFRLDKFMMLVRRFLRQIFVHLHLLEYFPKEVKDIADIFDTTVVAGGDQAHAIPLGLKLHITKIFLEELAKIGGDDLPQSVISTLLKPFMKAMILSEDPRYVKAIQNQIFNDLMRQSDVGLEYEMAEEGDGEDEEDDDDEDEDEDDEDLELDEEDEDLELDEEDEDLELDEEDEDLELDEEDEDLDEEFSEDEDDFDEDDDETGYDSELEEEAEEEEEIESEEVKGREKVTEKNKEKENGKGELEGNGKMESLEEKGEENGQDKERNKDNDIAKSIDKTEKKDQSQLDKDEGKESKNKKEEENENEEEAEESGDDEEDEEEEEEEESDEELALDPRAGGVDVSLPQLNPDFYDLAMQLKNLSGLGRLKPANRKIAKKVVQQLMAINKDKYPLARKAPAKIDREHLKLDEEGALYRLERSLPDDSIDLKAKKEKEKEIRKRERRRYKKQVREEAMLAKALKYEGKERTAKDYRERKQKILKDLKQMKEKRNIGISTKLNLPKSLPQTPFHEASLLMKEKKSKSNKLEASQVTKESNNNKTNKKRKGQSVPAPPKKMAFEVTNIIKPTKMPAPKTKNSFEITDISTSAPGKRPAENMEVTPIPNKKKKAETTVENREKKIPNGEVKASKAQKEKAMPNISTGKVDANQMPLQNGTTSSMVESVKKQKVIKQNGMPKATKRTKQGKNKGDMNSQSLQNGDVPTTQTSGKGKGSPWNEPLQKGEIEVFIKSRKQIEKEKQKSSIKVAPKEALTSQKEKSIRINLRQNTEHEFSDYARTLKNSPSIPFSADKLPKAPVLKPSPSPILVRKPAKKLLKVVAKTASPALRRSKAHDFF